MSASAVEATDGSCLASSRVAVYCFDRFTVPKLVGLNGAEHKNRPDTAVSLLAVTTTFVSENCMRSLLLPMTQDAGRDPGANVERKIVYVADESGWVCAVPEIVSPLANVADHGPDHATTAVPGRESASDNCKVPGPDTGSLIDPAQLPAGDCPVNGGSGVGVSVGDRGAEMVEGLGSVEPPPQPLNASASTRIATTGRRTCWQTTVRNSRSAEVAWRCRQ